jgi:hypothetical protein
MLRDDQRAGISNVSGKPPEWVQKVVFLDFRLKLRLRGGGDGRLDH